MGICVNGVAAGAVETEALKLYTADQNLAASSWQKTPVGRMVQPEDVANVVAFLCNDESAMIRGQIIVIDGGLSLTSVGYTAQKDDEGGKLAEP